ncbi:hypothetical protein FRC02_010169 [Tulasnella sp. 418]|nr:hypothetical protein FRC02_010169 [Tulasnella sp. 418]
MSSSRISPHIPPPLREEHSELTPLWTPRQHKLAKRGDTAAALVASAALLVGDDIKYQNHNSYNVLASGFGGFHLDPCPDQ